MTNDETTEVLSMLFRSFPSLAAWYEKHRGTIREVWLRTLANTDPDDAVSIIEKMIRGDMEMPANYEYDRIAILIKREAAALSLRRAEFEKSRQMTAEKFAYHKNAKTADSELERFYPAMSASRMLGVMKREGRITAEENQRMHEEVKHWHSHGGKVPDCIETTIGSTRK